MNGVDLDDGMGIQKVLYYVSTVVVWSYTHSVNFRSLLVPPLLQGRGQDNFRLLEDA